MVEDGITFPQEDYLDADCRRQHIGEKLITDCLAQTKRCEFKVMQFNAVVESNTHARHLYERLGFVQLGAIPGGFRMKNDANKQKRSLANASDLVSMLQNRYPLQWEDYK